MKNKTPNFFEFFRDSFKVEMPDGSFRPPADEALARAKEYQEMTDAGYELRMETGRKGMQFVWFKTNTEK